MSESNPWVVQPSKPQPVPAGSYLAEFLGADLVEIVVGGQTERRIRWRWKVSTGPQQGREASCLTERVIKDSAKSGRLMAGMLGRALVAEEDLSQALAGLVGKRYLVVVARGPKNGAECVQSATTPPQM